MEELKQEQGELEHDCTCEGCGDHGCPVNQSDPELEKKMLEVLKKDLMENRGLTEEQAEEEIKNGNF